MSFIELEYREKHKPFAMTALQSHDYYEIYCLLEGERQVFYENCMFTLTGGAVCVIPPFRMHKMEGGPYKRVNFYISADMLDQHENDFLMECAEKTAFTIEGEEGELFFSLIGKFASDNESKTPLNEKKLVSLFRVLVSILASSKLTSVSLVRLKQAENRDNRLILQIIDYINSNLEESISLDDISEKFFISKNSLCKKFRGVMRCSVAEFICGARLTRAKSLLVNTNMSMDKIAEVCGYSSANYFSLIFKKNVGISPLNYRKKK